MTISVALRFTEVSEAEFCRRGQSHLLQDLRQTAGSGSLASGLYIHDTAGWTGPLLVIAGGDRRMDGRCSVHTPPTTRDFGLEFAEMTDRPTDRPAE